MKTLEELKAALDAALAAAEAAPEDEALKTAVEEAQAAYDAKLAEQDSEDEDSLDEDKLDEKTKAYLAKLRRENASHRTKNKDLKSKFSVSEERRKAILKAAGITEESEKPEEQVKSLTVDNQTLAFRTAVLQSAVENGVGASDLEFFEFLVVKEAGKLEEGEEIPAETIADLAKKAKRGSGKANSSVGGGNKPPPGGDKGVVTFEKFRTMSITEKSDLYEKNPALYNELMAKARRERKLV